MIIRKLGLFLLLIAMVLSFNAVSQDDASENTDQYEKLEAVMYNTGNQFIYAFFGKELLMYYLNKNADIEAVEMASEQDLEMLAAPFNALTGKFFMGGLTIIYWLTVAYFILRMSLFGGESVWLMQRRGTTYMDQKEYRAFMIKVVVIGGLALVPIKISSVIVDDTFYTNAATALFFDMLGYTHQLGDEAMGELILEQKQNLTTITLPAPESKWTATKEINKFFACTRLDSERVNQEAHVINLSLFRESDDSVEGFVTSGECTLIVTFGFDAKSTEKVKIVNRAGSGVNLDENIFVEGQRAAFRTVLVDVLGKASRKSEVLVTYASEIIDNPFFEDRSTIGDGSGASLRQLEDWHDDCQNIYAFLPAVGSGITRKDRVVYDRLLSRCLSKDLTKGLLYPDTYTALNSYMSNRQTIQKEYALCTDNAALNSGSRFVSRYELNSNLTSQTEIQEIALDTCLADVCAIKNVANGSLYACANSVDLYESRLRDLQIKDRGTLMMGFYMFDLFLYQPPSTSAKAVYNKLNFEFREGKSDLTLPEKASFVTVPVNIPMISADTSIYDEVLNDLDVSNFAAGYPTVIAPTDDANSLQKLIPIDRLMECTKSPLQIVSGYVCGNVPSEFSKFGFDLLDVAVNLKTLLILGNTFAIAKDATTSSVTKIKERKGSNFLDSTSNVIKNAAMGSIVAFSAGGDNVLGGMIGVIDSVGFSTRDEFGRLGTAKINSLLNSVSFTAILAVSQMNANSMLFKLVNKALTVFIFLGFFMGFIFPLIPMLFVLSAITMFIYLVLKTVLLQGFKLVDAVFDRDPDLLSDKLDEVFSDWIATTLKLPMTIIGVVLSWLMSNVIIAHVLSTLDTNVITNSGNTGIFDFLVSILFSFIVIIVIYNMVLTVIESFYDFTVDWVLGQMSNSPFNEEKAIDFKDTQDLYSLVGR